QNRQIDVYDQARVLALCVVASSCKDVGSDAIRHCRGNSEFAEARPGQVSAALLIVAGVWIMNGVVKPDGESNFCWVLRKAGKAPEPSKARRHMLDGVVVAMGSAVTRDEFIKDRVSGVGRTCTSERFLKARSKIGDVDIDHHQPLASAACTRPSARMLSPRTSTGCMASRNGSG